MDWKDAIAPAIRPAEQGFVVRPHVHSWWTQGAQFGRVDNLDRLRFTETGRRVYFNADGTMKRPGERVVNPDMARKLRRLASEGADVLHRGEDRKSTRLNYSH